MKRGLFSILLVVFVSASFFGGCGKKIVPAFLRVDGTDIYFKSDYKIKNVILLIADGAGPNHYLSCEVDFPTPTWRGEVTTASLEPPVTDSAAAATAMATGQKVINEQIGNDQQNIGEIFVARGKTAGVVTNDKIYGATPAGFSARGATRYETAKIIASQEQSPIQYFAGQMDNDYQYGIYGGLTKFHRYQPAPSAEAPYLLDIVIDALPILSANTNGFFLMAENEYTDVNSHNDNWNGMKTQMLDFQNTVEYVLDWAATRKDTLVIITSDHECGGLELVDGEWVYTSGTPSLREHTAVNVPIWIYNAKFARQTIDNTDIFKIMRAFA